MKLGLILVFGVLLACSPRDGLRDNNSGGGGRTPQIAPTATVNSENAKLSTCNQATDPTWNTIRLFNELQMIFPKVNQLQWVIGKGTRNCVKVSSTEPVEIVIQKVAEGQQFDSTGAKYLVTSIEIVNTQDLLNDTVGLQKWAAGMAMTVTELQTFLTTDSRPQMTITHLKSLKGEGTTTSPAPQPDSPSVSPIVIFEGEEWQGKTPSDCSTPWSDMRVFPEIESLVRENLEKGALRVVLGSGARSCYRIGSSIGFSFKNSQGQFTLHPEWQRVVRAVVIRPLADLQSDPMLRQYLMEDMDMAIEDFNHWLSTLKNEFIHITWFEEVNP